MDAHSNSQPQRNNGSDPFFDAPAPLKLNLAKDPVALYFATQYFWHMLFHASTQC